MVHSISDNNFVVNAQKSLGASYLRFATHTPKSIGQKAKSPNR